MPRECGGLILMAALDLFEAVHRAAQDYRSPTTGELGASALTRDLGETLSTFLNRLNPHQDTHVLRAKDLVRVATTTRDLRIPQAFSYLAGGVHVPLPPFEASDAALLDLWTAKLIEDGDFARAMRDALEGHLSRAAVEVLEREAMESVSALLALVLRVKGMLR